MHFFESFHFGQVPYLELSLTVWLLIAIALAFDFLNGLHDAANSIATIVSTRVLSPQSAVIWAAFFNFVAFLVFPAKVAATIGKEVIDPAIITNQLLAATLIAACSWNLLTWYLGLPTSSSHALIGGLVGSGVAATSGLSALHWWGLGKIVLFIVLAPVFGLVLGVLISVAILWIFRRVAFRRVDSFFRTGQLFSAAFFSLGHGGNDAQKTMGIITALLVAASADGTLFPKPNDPPTEVVLACHLAMGLGTLCGGWRIVKTMGQSIIRLKPVDGFCAETSAAITLAATTSLGGIPISTTHTITGAIVGVGALKRFSSVNWSIAERVVWAWILTIPGSALVAAISWYLLRLVN